MDTKPSAIDSYLARIASIRSKVELFQQTVDNHFGHDSTAIHWAHVGDLGRVEAILDELLACSRL